LENCAGGVHDQLWQRWLWKGTKNRQIDAGIYIGDNIFWVLRTRWRTFLQKWACGAAGSALPWHGRGRRFDPDQVHQFSIMVAVYILQSESSGKFYIGCSENPVERLIEHNRGQTKSTRGRGPWKHVYQEQFTTLPEALRRERQLKSWKSHRSIQELIDCSASAERAPA
jgi:putative endonuclease